MSRSIKVGTLICGVSLGLLATSVAFAATQELTLQFAHTTEKPIPAAIKLQDIMEKLPQGFSADWESLRLKSASGDAVPYQIDDMDLSEGTSPSDELAFLATGPVVLEVSDASTGAAAYESAWTTMEDDDKLLVISKDGKVGFSVDEWGIVRLTSVGGVQKSWAGNLGLVRYAGWPESTYWFDKNLSNHWEATTKEEKPRVIASFIKDDAPVRATSVCLSESNRFAGLQLLTAVSVYTTGDVKVRSSVLSRSYTDMTKLQFVATDILGDFGDARHIMPAQRWLDWAEEKGQTAAEYWRDKGVLLTVDGDDYAFFGNAVGPQPAFWGASYIFASPERWRTNYSQASKVGVAEMVMDLPEISDTLDGKLRGLGWVLEGEWRTGYFRWIAGEIVDFRKNNGIAAELQPDMEKGDWSLHLIPRQKVAQEFYYLPYEAENPEAAVKFLEARYAELGSFGIW